MATAFSRVLSTVRVEGDDVVATVPADWMQGRSVFGGLQLAVVLAAMRTKIPNAPLRTLQTTFVAPVPAGELRVRARILRSGKNASHVEARIVDGENTLALVVGVFGVARDSVVSVTPVQQPVEEIEPFDLPFIEGVTPEFTQHFAVRWLQGSAPFTGSRSIRSVVRVGLKDEGMATEGHVVAIADFIPPLGLSHLESVAPGSTLTWMLEFLRERFDDLPLLGWRVDAELTAASGGYTNQSVMLWGPGGEPVALSRQTMVVFG
ncbi:MAG: thioesterase family protein [Myxococcaceae bacterium]